VGPHHTFDLPPSHGISVMEDYSFARQFVAESCNRWGDMGSMLFQLISDGEEGERRKLPGVGAYCDVSSHRSSASLC
jgi:hypothetical protein